MALFTIVLDHAGNTGVFQVTARSAINAIQTWAKIAPSLGIPAVGPAFTDRALNDLVFLDPTPITGSRNLWCTSTTYRGSLIILHVIATNRHPIAMGVSKLEKLVSTPPKKSKKSNKS